MPDCSSLDGSAKHNGADGCICGDTTDVVAVADGVAVCQSEATTGTFCNRDRNLCSKFSIPTCTSSSSSSSSSVSPILTQVRCACGGLICAPSLYCYQQWSHCGRSKFDTKAYLSPLSISTCALKGFDTILTLQECRQAANQLITKSKSQSCTTTACQHKYKHFIQLTSNIDPSTVAAIKDANLPHGCFLNRDNKFMVNTVSDSSTHCDGSKGTCLCKYTAPPCTYQDGWHQNSNTAGGGCICGGIVCHETTGYYCNGAIGTCAKFEIPLCIQTDGKQPNINGSKGSTQTCACGEAACYAYQGNDLYCNSENSPALCSNRPNPTKRKTAIDCDPTGQYFNDNVSSSKYAECISCPLGGACGLHSKISTGKKWFFFFFFFFFFSFF